MTELCSSTDSTPLFHLAPLLLHDLLSFTSFLLSHPLLFSYILLLSPHLLPLLSFLSPLLLSTSLLLLSLLTVPPTLQYNPPPLGRTFAVVLTLLRSDLSIQPAIDFTEHLSSMVLHSLNSSEYLDRQWQKEGLQRDGSMRSKERKKTLVFSSLSQEFFITEGIPIYSSNDSELVDRQLRKEGLQRDRSMRKEKEWKRTLACKLYEERMTSELCEERKVVDGAEEMDLLWEAYEVHADKAAKSAGRRKRERKPPADEEEGEEEHEEDEEETLQQLCCLQALRLSAGRMSLGMGRPSLVKISKALKGMSLVRRAGRRSRK